MTLRPVAAGLVFAAAFFFAAGCSESPAGREDDAAALLRRAAEAERTCAYVGYKRTIHGREGEARATRMKVSHTAAGRTLLEWEEGSGPARRWECSTRAPWLADTDLLLANYSATLDPSDGPVIAWRDTRRLTLRPARPGRPSLELLVDKATSVVLREEIRDFEGRVWLTNVFDTIEYRSPTDSASDGAAEHLADVRAADADAPAMPLSVTSAPEGFRRVSRSRDSRDGVREDWTDGLAAFSVTLRPGPAGPASVREGELQRRTCSGRASVTGVLGGFEVVVLGNLPVSDLEAVARSLAPAR
jgi:hypothetical protein